MMPLRWMMLIVLFLVRLAMGYQFQSVASVSTYLVTDLGLSYTQVGTLIGFFLLPGIFIAIPSGTLTRAVTDKNLLMIGALTMIVGALVSVPFGGRVLEVFGWITVSIVVTLSAAAVAMAAASQGIAPEALSIAFGVVAGIPAGALMALSAQALSADNRGPGLGIFYTWYYAGMTVGPALAGWTRDVSGSAAAPVILGAALLGGVILSIGVLRLLQATWPIETGCTSHRRTCSR
jgi:predicted MFS family arabinose efflux permease